MSNRPTNPVVDSIPRGNKGRKAKEKKKSTNNSTQHSHPPNLQRDKISQNTQFERQKGVHKRHSSPTGTKDIMEVLNGLSLHTPPPQPLKQQSFIGGFWSGSPSALQHRHRVEEYDPTSPITRYAY